MAIFPTLGNQTLPSWFANNDQPFNNSNTLLSVGLGLLSGKTAQDQTANAATNLYNARQDGRTYNRTLQFLKQNNPDLAQAVEAGALGPGDAYKEYYRQKLEAQQPRNSLMAVGKNLYDFQNGQWISPPAGMAASDEEWGLTPVWGQDGSGKTVLGQVSKSGKFKPLDTGNFTPTPVIQNIDTGTAIIGRNSRTGAEVTNTPKDVAGAAAAAKVGAAQGDAKAQYQSLSSKMPGLTQVVGELNDLGQKATYTATGQGVDFVRKQIGMDPRPEAVARAEYIAKVDNQVLPLLRDTFGAAFTQKEGETLRNTLGDPDKSPQEKQATLTAFIEQKQRDLAALAAQSGGQVPAAAPAGGNVDDLLKKYGGQ